jgi:3-oxoacyl-[acyl-carrier protein] reductase
LAKLVSGFLTGETMNLKGRVALITGVSRRKGIGFAIAKHLAAAGADLFVQSWSPFDEAMPWGADEIEAILTELREVGTVKHMAADFFLPDTAQHVVDAAQKVFGHVDILIANHAYSLDAHLHELNADILDRHLSVNVRGTLLLAKAFAAQHDGRNGGRVVMMTSGQAVSPMTETIAYAASKAAIQGITLTLSAELIKRGITVNTIDPGATDTGWASAEIYEQVKAVHPQGRWGNPDDAARLIAWLCSDEAQWITGQVIHSRGGL